MKLTTFLFISFALTALKVRDYPVFAQITLVDSIVSDRLTDGYLWYTTFYDSIFVDTRDFGMGAGDGVGGFVGGFNYCRSYVSFWLGEYPSDSLILHRATLSLYQHHCGGNSMLGLYPIWDVPGRDTIFCVVDHIDYGSYLDPADWTAGDLGNPSTFQSYLGIISDDSIVGWKSLEVTDCVQFDLNAERPYSQFRIRFPIDTDWDPWNDAIVFSTANSTSDVKPYLKLEFCPASYVSDRSHSSMVSNISVLSAYPNPFNNMANIIFNVESPSEGSIVVYSIMGEEMALLFSGELNTGLYNFSWNGKDKSGNQVSSGIYFISWRGNNFDGVYKIIFCK